MLAVIRDGRTIWVDMTQNMATFRVDMAIPTIKGTYSLDVETVRTLERLASRWGVSKSETLRRAIRLADAHAGDAGVSVLEALTRLQRSVSLSESQARDWAQRARAERRATSRRKEPAEE
jgi:hypothetical protein